MDVSHELLDLERFDFFETVFLLISITVVKRVNRVLPVIIGVKDKIHEFR